jgi:hypothetical protein
LDSEEDDTSVSFILQKLSSVISTGTANELIHISHLLFTEFICEPCRCDNRFAIHEGTRNCILALAYLKVMWMGLWFNICQLKTSHLYNVEVSDLASHIKQFILTYLSSSYHFWENHLQTTTVDKTIITTVKDFLHNNILYWLKILSLIKEINIVLQVLVWVQKWIAVSPL